MVTEEIAGESAKRGGEPREGVRGRGRKRQGPAGLPALRPGMTSRTSVLVMPGRGTLARRNGRVGPDGVVDDDEPARAFRRATTRVPRKARLAHASTVGTLGVGCCARRAWRRRSRARGGGCGYHVRMGVDARPRANPPLRFATPGHLAERYGSRLRGTWRNATDAFGRQRNAGITASSPMNGSSARMPDRRGRRRAVRDDRWAGEVPPQSGSVEADSSVGVRARDRAGPS